MPRDLLARLPLFAGLHAEELAPLTAGAELLRLAKGEFLFRRGDPCHGFYVVRSGKIKLSLPSRLGPAKVVDIVHAGHSFGEAVMFLDKQFLVDAEALMDTSLIHVPKDPVMARVAAHPLLVRKMLAYLAARVHRLLLDVESLALQSSRQRVATYLLQALDEQQVAASPGQILLEAAKGVLASRLGMTQERLSRVFRELSDEGVIAVRGRRIVIFDALALRLSIDPI